jgi:hypothetical protein
MLKEIIESKRKSKEKVSLVVEEVGKDKKLFNELMKILETGTDVEKGTCADAMKHITKENPEIALPYIDKIINYINHKVTRVKWGVPESIGNIAQKFPKEVEEAVPKLLINTKEESTVIRWCAAFGLTEIAKSNTKLQKNLIKKFSDILKKEPNNGVKNVYIKALKKMDG